MRNLQFIHVYSAIVSVIAITLIVITVRYYQAENRMRAELRASQTTTDETNKKNEELKNDIEQIKALIDNDVPFKTLTVSEIARDHKSDMFKYAPDNSGTHTYRSALVKLHDELVATKKEHKQEKDDRIQLEANYKNLQKLYETIVTSHDKERQKAIDDLRKESKEFQNTLATVNQRESELQVEKIAIQTKADNDVKAANDKKDQERLRAEVAENRCNELGSKLQQLLRPIFDRPDGVVEVVNLNTRTVVVDIGYADGVETRMTFSVYDPKISGISYDTNLYGENPVLCESCKRNTKLHASKGSVEIVRVLGPHRSEAMIIIDQLINPILAGDVIHSPIWDRGQRLRVALGSGMFLPEVGNPAGDRSLGSLEDVKNMIIESGGKVDCYISDGRSDGDIKRGEVIGLDNMTAETAFVVIGTVKEGTQESEIMNAQNIIRQKAKSLAIKEISLKELMLKLGWRNPTPLRDYGKNADEFDLRIKPEGGNKPSTGTVAPLYNKPNYAAGVSITDRGKPISTGKVSDIYTNNPSKSISTGNISNLFRQRKPVTNSQTNNQ